MSLEAQLALHISKQRARCVNAWSGGLEDMLSYTSWLGRWREIEALESFLAELKRNRGEDDEPIDDRIAARKRTGAGIGADAW